MVPINLLKPQFRSWGELEDYEQDRQRYVEAQIAQAKAAKKKLAARRRLYGPVKMAARKRNWVEKGGYKRTRDLRGRFVTICMWYFTDWGQQGVERADNKQTFKQRDKIDVSCWQDDHNA